MSKQLGPIVKRMRELGRDTTNTIQEFIGLSTGVDAISTSADDFDVDIDNLQKHILKISESWLRMYTDVQVLRAKKQEIAALPDLAEKMVDTIQILQLQDEVFDVDYIQLARCILHIVPAQLDAAVKEVGSFDGGKEQLALMRDAINEVLSPAEAT